jgi:hypothetical protein
MLGSACTPIQQTQTVAFLSFAYSAKPSDTSGQQINLSTKLPKQMALRMKASPYSLSQWGKKGKKPAA